MLLKVADCRAVLLTGTGSGSVHWDRWPIVAATMAITASRSSSARQAHGEHPPTETFRAQHRFSARCLVLISVWGRLLASVHGATFVVGISAVPAVLLFQDRPRNEPHSASRDSL